nr:PREDICTED: 28S ribosomal protein S36, mitochondrial [Tribolium castaneum]|eukprot:XP_008195193.1 PREDICTED: 28S ribosomal protein S36, mitochondrial [Tribolium castaneum]
MQLLYLRMNFSSIFNRTLSGTIARTPSIRFRYGASRDHKTATSGPTGAPLASPGAMPQPGEAIYDFQIPQRWRRRPLSEEEIAYINRGGPE